MTDVEDIQALGKVLVNHHRDFLLELVVQALQQVNVFRQPTPEDARAAVGKAIELLQTKWPAAAELLRDAEEDVLAYMHFPDQHWRQIKSTNPLERLNREIRRRTDVVGIFPNDASILRLVTMLLVEQNDEWAVGRRYFSLASMALVTGAADVPPRALEAG